MTTFITADAVADLIGFDSAAHFLRNRERLEDETDFPMPMPTCQRPLKWRADAVQAWVNRQGQAKPAGMTAAVAAQAGPNVIMLNEARRA